MKQIFLVEDDREIARNLSLVSTWSPYKVKTEAVRPDFRSAAWIRATSSGGIEAQKKRLEAEGHTIIQRGRTNLRYFVKDYEQALYTLE